MKHPYLSIPFALVLSSVLIGCGPKNTSTEKSVESAVTAASGPLSARVEAIEANAQATECDHRDYQTRLRIARAVDAHAETISRLGYDVPRGASVTEMGPATFIDNAFTRAQVQSLQRIAGKDGWLEVPSAWSEVEETFEKTSRGDDPYDWRQLARQLSSLLKLDEARVLRHQAFALRRRDLSKLMKLRRAYENCTGACTEPMLDADLRGYVQTDARLASRDYVMKESEERLFAPNPRLVLGPNQRYLLPVTAGNFKGGEALLSRYFHDTWSVGGAQIDLIFGDIDDQHLAISYVDQEEGKPVLNFAERRLEIHLGDSVLDIVRELGRALGFPSNEFVTWRADQCSYVTEVDVNDFMSSPRSGRVQAKHIQMLRRAYSGPVRADK